MAKRGRPAGFDRAVALQRAMELFWARGYEGATLEDLQIAMGGLTPPSFYHAFGSKEALFKEVADLYIATECTPPVRALEEAGTAREGIEAMLRRAVESFSQPGMPHGCLLFLGATKCAPANKAPQEYLQAVRQRSPEAIMADEQDAGGRTGTRGRLNRCRHARRQAVRRVARPAAPLASASVASS